MDYVLSIYSVHLKVVNVCTHINLLQHCLNIKSVYKSAIVNKVLIPL